MFDSLSQVVRFGVFAVAIVSMTTRDSSAAAKVTISGKVTAKKASSLPNTVVYLEQVAGAHDAVAKTARIDQVNQAFSPGVLPVVVGTTVDFLNSDNTIHNVFSPSGEKYDLGEWGKGEARHYTFRKPGAYAQLCKLHPAMLAYVVVLQNPYFAVTTADGAFEIDASGLPAGEYKLAVWNQRQKAAAQPVKVAGASLAGIEIKLGK